MLSVHITINGKEIKRVNAVRVEGEAEDDSIGRYRIDTDCKEKGDGAELGHLHHRYGDGAGVLAAKMLAHAMGAEEEEHSVRVIGPSEAAIIWDSDDAAGDNEEGKSTFTVVIPNKFADGPDDAECPVELALLAGMAGGLANEEFREYVLDFFFKTCAKGSQMEVGNDNNGDG